MANRLDWNALEGKIEHVMEEYEEFENERSKAFCAIAVSVVLDIDIDEAIDSITDGGNDRGIDAVFIDNRENRNDIHLFQAKCVEAFESSKRNFKANELDKAISYVSDLLNENLKSLNRVNEQLKQKTNDALNASKQKGATVSIHFVGNMKGLAQNELDRASITFERYTDVSFEMHDLESLASYFLERNVPSFDREIQAVDTNWFERTDFNLKGLVCTVTASDIVELIRSKREPDKVELGIFDQNVRVYLKQSNRINKKIIESAIAEDNYMFWYQNNGITITCDRMEVRLPKRSPIIDLKNLQIVNGGQTSNCLFEAAKDNSKKIESVLLLVRIIETNSEEVKLSIAESTNSQTPINARDLRANDKQQRKLQKAFERNKYFYERKAREFDKKPKDKRIDALSAGQAYLAYGLGFPEVAKKDRGRVFGNLYDDIFTDDLEVKHLLVSIQLLNLISERKKVIRKKIRDKKTLIGGEVSLIEGAFHILFTIRQILEREKSDSWSYEEGKKYLDDAIGIIYEIYQEAEEQETNFSPSRFFKDGQTKNLIIKKVR